MALILGKWAVLVLSCLVLSGIASRSASAIALERGDTLESPTPQQGGHVPLSNEGIDKEMETLRNDIKGKQTDAVYIRLGYLQINKGAFDDALQSFDEALKLNSLSHKAKVGKGIVMGWKGEFSEADRVLRDALTLNPDPANAHYELGLLYQERGDSGKAIKEYKAGLKSFQDSRK